LVKDGIWDYLVEWYQRQREEDIRNKLFYAMYLSTKPEEEEILEVKSKSGGSLEENEDKFKELVQKITASEIKMLINNMTKPTDEKVINYFQYDSAEPDTEEQLFGDDEDFEVPVEYKEIVKNTLDDVEEVKAVPVKAKVVPVKAKVVPVKAKVVPVEAKEAKSEQKGGIDIKKTTYSLSDLTWNTYQNYFQGRSPLRSIAEISIKNYNRNLKGDRKNISFYLSTVDNPISISKSNGEVEVTTSDEFYNYTQPNNWWVDFANKSFGGGVFRLGNVQEEHMLVKYPETLVVAYELENNGMNGEKPYNMKGNQSIIINDILLSVNYDESVINKKIKRKETINETDITKIKTEIPGNLIAIDAKNYSNWGLTQRKITRDISKFKTIGRIKIYTGYDKEEIEWLVKKAYAGFRGAVEKGFDVENSVLNTGKWGGGVFANDFRLTILVQLVVARMVGIKNVKLWNISVKEKNIINRIITGANDIELGGDISEKIQQKYLEISEQKSASASASIPVKAVPVKTVPVKAPPVKGGKIKVLSYNISHEAMGGAKAMGNLMPSAGDANAFNKAQNNRRNLANFINVNEPYDFIALQEAENLTYLQDTDTDKKNHVTLYDMLSSKIKKNMNSIGEKDPYYKRMIGGKRSNKLQNLNNQTLYDKKKYKLQNNYVCGFELHPKGFIKHNRPISISEFKETKTKDKIYFINVHPGHISINSYNLFEERIEDAITQNKIPRTFLKEFKDVNNKIIIAGDFNEDKKLKSPILFFGRPFYGKTIGKDTCCDISGNATSFSSGSYDHILTSDKSNIGKRKVYYVKNASDHMPVIATGL